MAKYKLISCNVYLRELLAAISESPNVIDPEFLELGLHERPSILRSTLQERIDAASTVPAAPGARSAYEAILLGYGLCGNGLAGIEARGLPLVLARAHDCCTILLGSRAAFSERFGDSLSASWSSAGYIERGVGEGGAAYVLDEAPGSMAERELRFIETSETAGLGYADAMRARAATEGKDFLLIPGSSRLLRALVAGGWDEAEFLVVPPGSRIAPLYDLERVFEAEAPP